MPWGKVVLGNFRGPHLISANIPSGKYVKEIAGVLHLQDLLQAGMVGMLLVGYLEGNPVQAGCRTSSLVLKEPR